MDKRTLDAAPSSGNEGASSPTSHTLTSDTIAPSHARINEPMSALSDPMGWVIQHWLQKHLGTGASVPWKEELEPALRALQRDLSLISTSYRLFLFQRDIVESNPPTADSIVKWNADPKIYDLHWFIAATQLAESDEPDGGRERMQAMEARSDTLIDADDLICTYFCSPKLTLLLERAEEVCKQGKRQMIILVDDPLTQWLVARLLSHAGHNVRQITDPKGAINARIFAAFDLGEIFDILVMQWRHNNYEATLYHYCNDIMFFHLPPSEYHRSFALSLLNRREYMTRKTAQQKKPEYPKPIVHELGIEGTIDTWHSYAKPYFSQTTFQMFERETMQIFREEGWLCEQTDPEFQVQEPPAANQSSDGNASGAAAKTNFNANDDANTSAGLGNTDTAMQTTNPIDDPSADANTVLNVPLANASTTNIFSDPSDPQSPSVPNTTSNTTSNPTIPPIGRPSKKRRLTKPRPTYRPIKKRWEPTAEQLRILNSPRTVFRSFIRERRGVTDADLLTLKQRFKTQFCLTEEQARERHKDDPVEPVSAKVTGVLTL